MIKYNFQPGSPDWDQENWIRGGGNWHIAEYYRSCGMNVLPLIANGKGSKATKIEWSEYQYQKYDDTFSFRRKFIEEASGIGVLCGVSSGNLELLEHECDLDLDNWILQVEAELGKGFVDRLIRVDSPRGGIHFWYRCSDPVGRNMKLAWDQDNNIMIETRGQGGMGVLPGSHLRTHKTGKPYRLVSGSFEDIPVISPEEREVLLAEAVTFDRSPPREAKTYTSTGGTSAKGTRPGDEFNASGEVSWAAILEPVGWSLCKQGAGQAYWTRPGKSPSEGASATTGIRASGLDTLKVFSPNARPLETEGTYTKFAAYAALYHGGDYGRAACDLSSQGFGVSEILKQEEQLQEFFSKLEG